jgi:ubiquinone/menaquinone biosynthesis C-methylase UbiE
LFGGGFRVGAPLRGNHPYNQEALTRITASLEQQGMGAARRFLKQFLQLPADALIASSKKLPGKISDTVQRDPRLIAKFYPYKADWEFFILLKSSRPDAGLGYRELPLPPEDLWAGYGTSAEYFLNSGNVDVNTMKTVLVSSGFRFGDGNRLLDFGCAAGRMLRWFDNIALRCEIWGVDISARHIIWCQEHLSPPFKFATVTTAPHLPFEDGYFDLIYCGSVFTHIADLADAWLLELKRILTPDGRLYITVHDKHTLDLIVSHPEKVYSDGLPADASFRNLLISYDRQEKLLNVNFDMFVIGRGPDAQVFYDVDYLVQHWGSILNVLSITPEAYGYQTAIVLAK